ncbi:MAG: hypothetical protein L3J31_08330 [Bacteroidales bacterium]|nr:hypothetical protein [Bacteroidales bacterium]
MKKLFFLFLALSLLSLGCEQAKKKATKEAMKSMQPKKEVVQLDAAEKYHAVVTAEMTLSEVAKANKMTESFLKQKLGIPQYVDHPYTILELSRNYKFTVEELQLLIESHRDRKTVQSKKAAQREKGKN